MMTALKTGKRGVLSRLRKWRLPIVAVLVGMLDVPAHAQRVENAVAIFAALDKVTAAVKQLTVQLNKTGEFRTLKITPRACYTRAPTEPPRTSTFVEIDEVMFDGKEKRIFSGWMFAESPGLNPLLHPVFDVWLTACSAPQGGTPPPSAKAPPQGGQKGPPTEVGPPPGGDDIRRRPRPR
jgi:hypothetical protein